MTGYHLCEYMTLSFYFLRYNRLTCQRVYSIQYATSCRQYFDLEMLRFICPDMIASSRGRWNEHVLYSLVRGMYAVYYTLLFHASSSLYNPSSIPLQLLTDDVSSDEIYGQLCTSYLPLKDNTSDGQKYYRTEYPYLSTTIGLYQII